MLVSTRKGEGEGKKEREKEYEYAPFMQPYNDGELREDFSIQGKMKVCNRGWFGVQDLALKRSRNQLP